MFAENSCSTFRLDSYAIHWNYYVEVETEDRKVLQKEIPNLPNMYPPYCHVT